MTDFVEEEHHINFTWHSNLDLPEVSAVELILAPARSVWDDHFDENDYQRHTACHGLHKMEDGNFTANVPLKINTYHFLFRINNCTDQLTASYHHNVTYLANGRLLNYINVGHPLEYLLNRLGRSEYESKPSSIKREQTPNEKTPLVNSGRKRGGLRRFFPCCMLD